MSTYLIGDIHGCYNELQLLLQQVSFDSKKDTLWITGDLVSRGPKSLEVLRYVRALGNAGRMVLGNHDLHLLAVYTGVSRNNPKDRIESLLKASDAEDLIDWLRYQPLLRIDEEKKLIMTHAGITPQWDIETAKMCAYEVESVLSSSNYPLFLCDIYNHNNAPKRWSLTLTKQARLCFSINALTRMRYCFPNGDLDMVCKEIPNLAPYPLKPWFFIKSTVARDYTIIFGHWSLINGKGTPKKIIGLDTGCCWGGKLTMLRWEDRQVFIQASNFQKNHQKNNYIYTSSKEIKPCISSIAK